MQRFCVNTNALKITQLTSYNGVSNEKEDYALDEFASNLSMVEILDLLAFSRLLTKSCVDMYNLKFFHTYSSAIPDEIWCQVFRYLNDENYFRIDLITVSKKWRSYFLTTEKLRLKHVYSFSNFPSFISQYSRLTSLKIFDIENIDFFMLRNLTHLSLKSTPNTMKRTTNYENLSLLTNLTSLSISDNERVDDIILRSFSPTVKSSLTYLNLNNNNKVMDLVEFTYLRKLNLKNNKSVTNVELLKNLECLKLTSDSLKKLSNYSGYGCVYFSTHDYFGELSQGTLNGVGKCIFHKGDKYYGNFMNGKKHGFGCYTFISGNIYEGEWICEQMHGKGVLIQKNGQRIEGEWIRGERVS